MLPQAGSAAWVSKAFRAQKVRLEKASPVITVNPNEELLVLADSECLLQQQAADKHHRDPLQSAGFAVKHKTFAALVVQAVPARLMDSESTADLEMRLQQQPCVLGVAPNPRVETAGLDPLLGKQSAWPVIAQAEGEKFFFHPLWGIQREVTVGVVDSGMQLDHPDLASRLWHGPSGEVGFDFVNNDEDPSDDFGHGTHVAGLVGAQRGNDIGIRGVMGEWSRLMPVKSQDDKGGGNMADVINAVRWAVDHGAEVLNLSLIARQKNAALADAIEYALSKKVTVVVASGNQGEEITDTNFIAPVGYAPDYAGLISVGSVDAGTRVRSTFSNYSPNYVEISAPGSSGIDGIVSTYIPGKWAGLDGTSMSSPQVAGAAALVTGFLKTHAIKVEPSQIEQLITLSAIAVPGQADFFTEGRRLNLENLGRYLFNSTFVDSTGGFDAP